MAGTRFQQHRAAAGCFGEQTVKAASAVKAVALSMWTGSFPLFLLVSSSAQESSGKDKAEVRAVVKQGGDGTSQMRVCLCQGNAGYLRVEWTRGKLLGMAMLAPV